MISTASIPGQTAEPASGLGIRPIESVEPGSCSGAAKVTGAIHRL